MLLAVLELPTRAGGREQAYCTALGKAMLAFEYASTRSAALADMPRRTETTITDPRAIEAELERVRRTGIAVDRGEGYRGVACLAAPIRSSTGRAIGAVPVTGPIALVRPQVLQHEVRSTAAAVWEGRPAVA